MDTIRHYWLVPCAIAGDLIQSQAAQSDARGNPPSKSGYLLLRFVLKKPSVMKRLSKLAPLLAALVALALAIDYWNVTRKEKLLSNAVSQIGGRNGAITLWPLGSEYRITLTSLPTPDQLDQLRIANKMRGSVGIALENCELAVDDVDRLRANLKRCHLFVVQNGKMLPLDAASTKRKDHPMRPSGEVGRYEVDDRPSPPADR